ncbi:outer membrane beta-barrel protein [Seonamhaeicola marinus]|uniref:PorT family protein n=1 Tax=Seonamhaeicola marinus TaxID=1912246 RepID=A0A5D0HR28_9FLAO|nr:outer membrane beta-barrel protein [Seonamhaeicola marinus]TYA71842.1 PorT family protein [Seonamhaeicola marinus]
MKKINVFIALGFVLLLTSCGGARAGYFGGCESYSYSISESALAGKTVVASKTSNASNASVLNEFSNNTSKSGFFIGYYFTDIELGSKLELQPEINFVSVKDLEQIQVPILAKYEVIDKINVLAGPNIGYLIDAPTGVKSINFSGDVGAAYELTENLNVNARYNFGISNLLDNPGGNATSRLSGFQVGLGYQF